MNQVGCMGACERGPNIRVRTSPGAGQGKEAKIYEINAVSNLAKVTSVLRDLLNVPVSDVAVATLEANLAGNQCLQRNEITLAIEAYDRAMSFGYEPQRGVLLSMRAGAYLLRAFTHRKALEKLGRFPTQLDFGPLLEHDEANVVASGTGAFGFRGASGNDPRSSRSIDSAIDGRVAGASAGKETTSRGWRARLFATIRPFLSLKWLERHFVQPVPLESTTKNEDLEVIAPATSASKSATAEDADLVTAAAPEKNASLPALPFAYLKAKSSPLRLRQRLLGWWLQTHEQEDVSATPSRAYTSASSTMERDIAATVAAARSAALASSSDASSSNSTSAAPAAASANTADSKAKGVTSSEEEMCSAKDTKQLVLFHTRLYRHALLKYVFYSLRLPKTFLFSPSVLYFFKFFLCLQLYCNHYLSLPVIL